MHVMTSSCSHHSAEPSRTIPTNATPKASLKTIVTQVSQRRSMSSPSRRLRSGSRKTTRPTSTRRSQSCCRRVVHPVAVALWVLLSAHR